MAHIPDATRTIDSPMILVPAVEVKAHCTVLLLKLSLTVTLSWDV